MREAEIIQRLQRREQQSLRAFTLHYSPLMRYIIAPILPDPREQEECLADLHLHIWDRIHLFDPNKGFYHAQQYVAGYLDP
jgi:RNA polymerase sigma-70 factor (ECF subfamily)